MISIKSGITPIHVENAYSSISNSVSIDLRLPKQLSLGGTFGVTASLIQYMATWARASSESTLISYGTKSSDESFSNLVLRPHGLIGTYLAPNLADAKGNPVNKNKALAHATHIVAAMRRGDLKNTMHGRGVLLACLAGAKHEWLPLLYGKPNRADLRGIRDFQALTRNIIETCVPGLRGPIPDFNISKISQLIRELFENTNDHATTDEKNNPYSWSHPSIRAILAKHISFRAGTKNFSLFEGDPAHALFFQRSVLSNNPKNQPSTNFIELTIIDTGPGISRRWLKYKDPEKNLDDITFEEEVELIQEAFKPGTTSKGFPGAGFGLDTILQTLRDLHALMRLRTGRVCLYQDFSSISKPGFSPHHWLKDRPMLSPTTGTSYNIAVPLLSRNSK